MAAASVAGAGLLRESSVASALGLDVELDAFVTSFGLLVLVGSALVSTASSALLPELARRTQLEDSSSRDFAGAALLSAFLVGAVASGVLLLAGPSLAHLVAGSDPVKVELIQDLLRLATLVIVTASAVRGVLVAMLQANGHYPLPAGIQVVSSLSMATAAVVIAEPTVHDLMRWYLIGLTIEVLVLAISVWRSSRPRIPSARRFGSLMIPVAPRVAYSLGATLVFGLNPLIDYAIANDLDPGAAARLSVSSRVPLASAALIVAVVVTPSYTALSQAFGRGGRSLVLSEYDDRVRRLLRLSAVLAVIVAMAGVPIAYVFFAYGELTGGDAGKIALTQAVYAAAIPAYVAGVLASRALLAADRQALQFAVGLAGAVANLLLDLLLGELIGVNGIAAATGFVYIVTFLAMTQLVRSGIEAGDWRPAPEA